MNTQLPNIGNVLQNTWQLTKKYAPAVGAQLASVPIVKQFVYDDETQRIAPQSPVWKMTGKQKDTEDLAMNIGMMMGGVQPVGDIMKASIAKAVPKVGSSDFRLTPNASQADIINRVKGKPVEGGGIDAVWNNNPTLKARIDDAFSKGDDATVQKLLPQVPEQYKANYVSKTIDPLLSEAKKYKSAEEFVNSLKQDKSVLWHGSPTGQMRGGKQGLHIGTFKAAQDALEARIGIPANGRAWDGTTEYGKTLLAGKKTQRSLGRGGTGFNVDVPENDFYPSQLKGWENPQYTLKDKPTIQPVKIKGQMSNSPQAPMGDYQAGGRMAGQIKKGNAKSGYFYKNVSEDEGSISAVVPSKEHLSQLTDIWNKANKQLPDITNLIK